MKASEFINDFKILIEEHGDFDVIMIDGTNATIEFNNDPGEEPAFIIS